MTDTEGPEPVSLFEDGRETETPDLVSCFAGPIEGNWACLFPH